MIKKSDVLALLEDFPEEFELADLRSLADRFDAAPPLTQAQMDESWAIFDRMRKEGGHSLAEVKESVEACLQELK